jgi:hypothetical protein
MIPPTKATKTQSTTLLQRSNTSARRNTTTKQTPSNITIRQYVATLHPRVNVALDPNVNLNINLLKTVPLNQLIQNQKKYAIISFKVIANSVINATDNIQQKKILLKKQIKTINKVKA